MAGSGARRTDRARPRWALPALLLGSVALLTAVPPWLGPEGQAAIMELFAPLCHQIPERSFWLAGAPMAVCHRCTGIYLGLFGGALMWRAAGSFTAASSFERAEIVGPGARLLIVIAVAPAAVDWMAGLAGLWQSGAFVRVATGLWFGAGTGLLVTDGLARLGGRLIARIRHLYPIFDSP